MATAATGSNPELTQEARQGLGKAALIVALLAVVLMVVFFFSLRQNIAAINNQVKGVTGAEEKVETMQGKVDDMESKVADLDAQVQSLNQAMDKVEGLPEETRRVVYESMMDEMAQKADMLGQQLDGAAKEKLAEVNKILEELKKDL
ncbi:MAG: hypothetical protein ACOCQT_00950 [Desulfovermiculus sp.]